MIKSPLNYIGGKYKLLPQILPLFPEQINTFVDLFAGGLDVSINVVNCLKSFCFAVSITTYFVKVCDNQILVKKNRKQKRTAILAESRP